MHLERRSVYPEVSMHPRWRETTPAQTNQWNITFLWLKYKKKRLSLEARFPPRIISSSPDSAQTKGFLLLITETPASLLFRADPLLKVSAFLHSSHPPPPRAEAVTRCDVPRQAVMATEN